MAMETEYILKMYSLVLHYFHSNNNNNTCPVDPDFDPRSENEKYISSILKQQIKSIFGLSFTVPSQGYIGKCYKIRWIAEMLSDVNCYTHHIAC